MQTTIELMMVVMITTDTKLQIKCSWWRNSYQQQPMNNCVNERVIVREQERKWHNRYDNLRLLDIMITAIFSHSVSTNACIQNHIQSHAFRIKIIRINQSVKFVDWWFFALLLIYISSAVHNWWWCENNRNLKHCFMELNCDAEKNNRCSWLWKFRIQNNEMCWKKSIDYKRYRIFLIDIMCYATERQARKTTNWLFTQSEFGS